MKISPLLLFMEIIGDHNKSIKTTWGYAMRKMQSYEMLHREVYRGVAKSLDTQILAVTFKVNFAPPSVGLSLGFKCFIAAKLSPNQNIYSINTIVAIYFLDL